MIINKKLLGVFFIFLLLFSISLISAAPDSSTESFSSKVKSYWGKTKTYYQDTIKTNLIEVGNATEDWSKEKLGFSVPAGRIWTDFWLGFFVGLVLWIWLYVKDMIRFAVTGRIRYLDRAWFRGKVQGAVGRMNLAEGKVRWHDFIARDAWKIPVIGVTLAVLMQIPLLNTVLRWVTLEFFLTGTIWRKVGRVLLISVELWFIPAFFEKLNKQKIKSVYSKAIRKAKKSQAEYDSPS
jgi:hypothetical protein